MDWGVTLLMIKLSAENLKQKKSCGPEMSSPSTSNLIPIFIEDIPFDYPKF